MRRRIAANHSNYRGFHPSAVIYEAIVSRTPRMFMVWGMPQTRLKVVLPERVGADFEALKATLRVKNNEVMLKLLLTQG